MEDKGIYEYDVQVACLSDIVGLQRKCEQQQLQFSAETNEFLLYQTLKQVGPILAQKLISKLVEKGQLNWDENEDYEVEQIVDHCCEDGKDYYLIKWKGWSRAYNSWEPNDNLNCEGLLDEFQRLNSAKMKKNGTLKRAAVAYPESKKSFRNMQLNELWEKINKNGMHEKLTPLELLSASSPKKVKGLLALGSRSKHTRKLRFKPAPNYKSKKTKNYKEKKAEMKKALWEWEAHLNSICTDPSPIVVENDVDLEGPPDNFEYINDYRAGEGIHIPQDPIMGCDCGTCNKKGPCCPHNSGAEFAYYRCKRVMVPQGTPIYECNKRCKCDDNCANRVVQQGRKCKVSIFRTNNGRGWGVKTLQKMKKGTFVMEYVGEVITSEEAERRGKIYDAEGRTYLFDLDYNDGDCPFTVDAGFCGNISHFVNHSCDPNLVVYGVWINTLDPRLPRIALFSARDIDKGEELTFDYMMTGDTTQQSRNNKLSAYSDIVDSSEAESGSPNVSFSRRLSLSPVQHTVVNGSPSEMDISDIPAALPMQKNLDDSVSGLSSDSGNSLSMSQYRIICQCGSKNCRQYLF
ncbi:histone-lysine N-methyltransferase SUV39H2-like [Liolophura sinensis]|uniref:histone-lysine N-methyltransferase SUV39H2-like n=1 Tax=Liolophura sinensis TaxID=3198878 RepID=UPI003158FCF0